MKTPTKSPLLTKRQACEELELSPSTFYRWRKKFGLEPEKTIKTKPALFHRAKIEALKNMSGNGHTPIPWPHQADRGRLLTLKEIKARAKKGGKR